MAESVPRLPCSPNQLRFNSLNVATLERPRTPLMTKLTIALFAIIPIALGVGVGSVLLTDSPENRLIANSRHWVGWLVDE